MDDNTVTDSNVTDVQEVVESTEPVAATEESQVNTNDAWSEDFDMDSEPTMDTVEAVEPKVEASPEYITEGLGDLDKPIVVKVNGKIYDIKDKDQIRNLMEKGFNATQKLQEVAELRRELEQYKNPEATVEQLDAIGDNAEIESISQSILNSSYADSFKDSVGELPEGTLNELRTSPRMLKGLSVDFESGLAQKIMPMVGKLMDIESMSFQEAYTTAGRQVMSKQDKVSNSVNKLVAEPRTSNNVEVKQDGIWDMSDSDFNALMDTERR